RRPPVQYAYRIDIDAHARQEPADCGTRVSHLAKTCQQLLLHLPDALAGNAELGADFIEGASVPSDEPIAQNRDLTFVAATNKFHDLVQRICAVRGRIEQIVEPEVVDSRRQLLQFLRRGVFELHADPGLRLSTPNGHPTR